MLYAERMRCTQGMNAGNTHITGGIRHKASVLGSLWRCLLVSAHSDPLWVQTCFRITGGGGGAVGCRATNWSRLQWGPATPAKPRCSSPTFKEVNAKSCGGRQVPQLHHFKECAPELYPVTVAPRIPGPSSLALARDLLLIFALMGRR